MRPKEDSNPHLLIRSQMFYSIELSGHLQLLAGTGFEPAHDRAYETPDLANWSTPQYASLKGLEPLCNTLEECVLSN